MSRKKKNSPQSTAPSTWRSIQQSFSGRAVTPHARKRRWCAALKVLGGVWALALLGTGAWYAASFLKSDSFAQMMARGSEPVRSIYLETDGVLDEAWLNSQIELPSGVELMAVDIARIQRELSDEGQVASALVERVFPEALRVTIAEREPILRLALSDAAGRKYMRLLSRDGVVYAGKGYPVDALRHLPFAQGITLRRKVDGSFEPVAGIAPVGAFLDEARALAPEQYARWKTLSLRDFDPDGASPNSRLLVTTRDGVEIAFSPDDLPIQLARLSAILGQLDSQRRRVERIDLSYDDVVVKLAEAGVRGPSHFR